MTDYVVWMLSSIVIFQQIFWAFQVHRLVDKIMSKSYYDYELSRTLSEPKEKPKPMDGFGPYEDIIV